MPDVTSRGIEGICIIESSNIWTVTRAESLAEVGHLFFGGVHVNVLLQFVSGMEYDQNRLYTPTPLRTPAIVRLRSHEFVVFCGSGMLEEALHHVSAEMRVEHHCARGEWSCVIDERDSSTRAAQHIFNIQEPVDAPLDYELSKAMDIARATLSRIAAGAAIYDEGVK